MDRLVREGRTKAFERRVANVCTNVCKFVHTHAPSATQLRMTNDYNVAACTTFTMPKCKCRFDYTNSGLIDFEEMCAVIDAHKARAEVISCDCMIFLIS